MADLIAALAATAGGVAVESDDDFANTVLLLHGDGTDGTQNNTFLDSSTNNFTITRNGNTTQGSFTPFSKPDGRWGNFFDGSGDDVSFPIDSAFTLGSNEFTIEGWVYPNTVTSSNALFSLESSSYPAVLILCGTGTISFLVSSTRSSFQVNLTGFALQANTWSHIVLQRNGDVFRAFINGVVVGSETQAITLQSQRSVGYVGRDDGGSVRWNGYVASFRVVNGTAVYSTSGFTPPTAPLTAIANTSLLTCQSNRFVDNSTNNFAITRNGDVKVTPFSPFPLTTEYSPAVNGGSMYSDGTGDWLTAPTDTGYDFTGDFTIELWVYTTRSTNQEFGTGTSAAFMGGGNSGWHIQIFNSSNALTFTNQVSNSFPVNSSLESNAALIPLNAWNHIVVSRVGSTIRGFINGVEGNSTITYASTISSNQYLSIGSGWGGNYPFQGYIAGVKITDGTGVASVTVPTAPPTTTNTPTILCNFTNAGIFDNTGFNNLESVGNSQVDTTTKVFGTGSVEFDGTGDNLLIPSSENLAFGTGSWTVEFWLYPNDVSGLEGLVTIGAFRFFKNNDGLWFLVSAGSIANVASVLTASTWQHIALVKVAGAGTPITIYVDGVSVATGNDGATNYTAAACYIGSEGAGSYLNSLIDDLRITKGVARYTTTFTPPTKAFPNIGS
jgi:hypothetical protein